MKLTVLKILYFLIGKLNEQKGMLKTRVHDPKYPTIYCDGENQHVVMMPNGQLLYGLVNTKVYDQVGDLPYAKFESIVNLATNEKEARKIYETDTGANQ